MARTSANCPDSAVARARGEGVEKPVSAELCPPDIQRDARGTRRAARSEGYDLRDAEANPRIDVCCASSKHYYGWESLDSRCLDEAENVEGALPSNVCEHNNCPKKSPAADISWRTQRERERADTRGLIAWALVYGPRAPAGGVTAESAQAFIFRNLVRP